jgi:hypothetical protein
MISVRVVCQSCGGGGGAIERRWSESGGNGDGGASWAAVERDEQRGLRGGTLQA